MTYMEANPFLEVLLLCATFPAAHVARKVNAATIAEFLHCLPSVMYTASAARIAMEQSVLSTHRRRILK